jgi:flagellar basal body-associated protein FliL
MWIHCPHCNEKTQLMAPPPTLQLPTAQPGSPQKKSTARTVLIIIVGVVVLALLAGVAVMFIGFKAQTRKQIPAPVIHRVAKPQTDTAQLEPETQTDLWNGLKPGTVSIEKSAKSRLVYVTGTVRNDSEKQRFGVRVTLDLLNSSGEKIGSTTDYTQFIDAHKEWSFKALVANPKVTNAKISSIKED